MRITVHVVLFVLAALEIVAGLIAGSAALLSLTTEALARSTSAAVHEFSRRAGVDPVSQRLRSDLAAVLSVNTPEGASR